MKTVSLLLSLVLATLLPVTVSGQTSAFTYQGQLKFNGTPANGVYDFMFRLLNDPIGGTAAPVIAVNPAVAVSNGVFTTGMDFGAENLGDANLWLEVSVRTNGASVFTTLSPRQLLTSAPYAVRALAASNLLGALPASQLSGTVPNSSLPTSPIFSGTVTANNFFGNGAGVTNVNATTLNGLNSSSFWRTTGNAGTIAGAQFLGTTDDQPLEFKVNGQRVMRFESGIFGTPNVIGGSSSNYVASGVFGATISGGGGAENGVDYQWNSIAGNFGSIGGGMGNTVTNGAFDTIAGGVGNSIAGSPYSAIAGGAGNSINDGGYLSAIGGGGNNEIVGDQSTIGGGYSNHILSGSGHSVIGGGAYNLLIGLAGSISGGEMNAIEASWASTIAGGFYNRIGTSDHCVVGGGDYNSIGASSKSSLIAGGSQNTIGTNTPAGTISGGQGNFLDHCGQATIAGGVNNRILQSAYTSVISGGAGNEIRTNSPYNVIGGGAENTIPSNSQFGTIPGGQYNAATNWAFAAGHAAQAIHTGAFVWANSSFAFLGFNPLSSTNANSVTMRASGGYRLFTDSEATAGAFLAPGSGSWTSMSDRNTKENFSATDPSAVLEKVVALPVQMWNYKSQNAGVRHIGPTAQDFKAAFEVGESDAGISNVDADGVALAAIQGLNQKLEAARTENARLTARLEKLETLVRNLSATR